MKRVFRVIEKVAGEEETVLVRGETGTGKELVARALHDRSNRVAGPFVAINCAALPATLLESELFGHVRGAFTGAVRDAPGQFQLAHRGTLFLDEVAELPLELQAKLLRALETRSVLPVGGRQPIAIDVRVVSATHRALRREVNAGRFRADLMYRLRVIPVFIPPLRERPNDVELLCHRIVEHLNARGRRRIEAIDRGALEVLTRYDWPGNVRELRNVLAYAFAIGEGPTLTPEDLPPELVHPELDHPELDRPELGRPELDRPELDRPELETPVLDWGRSRTDRPRSDVIDPPSEHSSSTARASRGTRAVKPRTTRPSPAIPATDERARIEAALAESGGARARAAELLGMSRVTLWRRMRALALSTPGPSTEGSDVRRGRHP